MVELKKLFRNEQVDENKCIDRIKGIFESKKLKFDISLNDINQDEMMYMIDYIQSFFKIERIVPGQNEYGVEIISIKIIREGENDEKIK